jgi:hypothetical protein
MKINTYAIGAILALFLFLMPASAATDTFIGENAFNYSEKENITMEFTPLYAQWGHFETNDVKNKTAVEAYWLFNLSPKNNPCDQSNLAACDLFDPIGAIRQLQDYGVLVSFVICRDGTIIKLADEGGTVWHSRGYNNISYGIRFICLNETIAAEFSRQTQKAISPGPNELQYKAFARLIAYLNQKHPQMNEVMDFQSMKNGTVTNSTIDWLKVKKNLSNTNWT